jgi:hypothetical protein
MALGISPSELIFDLQAEGLNEKSVFVENFGAAPTAVSVKLAGFDEIIQLKPQLTTINPGEIKAITLTLNKWKNLKTEIEIFETMNLESELDIQSGIRIPLEVNAQSFSLGFAIPLALAFVLTLVLAVILKRRKRT